jgi:alanine racemase
MTHLDSVPPHVSAVLEVDLSAIAANYREIQSFLKPGTKAGAVIKANAYGLGVAPILKRLYESGCRDFFFAYLEEAIAGRRTLQAQDANMYVLYGVFKDTEDLFLQHELIPSLISLEQAHRWRAFCQKINKRLPCLLHVDTGLGREGLTRTDFQSFIDQKETHFSLLDVRYLISHLGNSNDATDPKNNLQLQRFVEMYEQLPGVKASLANSVVGATFINSSGIALGPEYQFDLVRPGMALYGYKSAFGDYPLSLTPSVKAYGRILLTRTVPKGETIGYQGIFTCERETKLALISVGHSDGVARLTSNVGKVKINRHPALITGRVSMDVIMADITDHPEDNVIPGQWATLYDDEESIRAFSLAEQTSIYELLVRHGNRYHRLYTN